MKNLRLLWRPKLQPMKVQCVSCPFRAGNDAEFRAVCAKLRADDRPLSSRDPDAKGLPIGKPVTARDVAQARRLLKIEASQFGDFSCHQSAYNPDMTVKPYREHRQCPGASKVFVEFGEKLYRGKK